MVLSRIGQKVRRMVLPTAQDRALQRWYADQGDFDLRQTYDLTESSIVLDLGGYRGQWASDIFARYQCNIVVFEPVAEFAAGIANRFRHNSRIVIHQVGLGGRTRSETIHVSADGSSTIRQAGKEERIQIVDVVEWFTANAIEDVALMKINIEGGEYELLDRMIEAELIGRVCDLQIQFHDVTPDARARMKKIQSHLRQTHRPTYSYEFVWENWSRNLPPKA
jgi:FkbM family methyltransferase